MKEFKVGDKVLVEAEITNIFDGRYNLKTTYRGASICMMEMQSNKVYPLSAGKTYEDGMAEAWDLSKNISTQYTEKELGEIFGFPYPLKLLELTAQEAAAKIKAWEDAKEIHAGDVVKITVGKYEGIVSKVEGEGCYVIFGDGSSRKFRRDDLIKTGRKIDIAGLLAEIGGRNEHVE